MGDIDREDIHIIGKHSNWQAGEIDKALKRSVYNDKLSWRRFIRILLITLGVGFTVSGIVFFFAYNWADLHKFAKLILVQALVLGAAGFALFSRSGVLIRQVTLTGAAILVGALFAVFGQVYQTGANAYDFFLAWTIFITLWVLVSGFPPLWLLFIILINSTLILYYQQVTYHWSEQLINLILFSLNALILTGFTMLSKFRKLQVPEWLLHVLALWVVFVATYGICAGIFGKASVPFIVLVVLTALGYGAGVWLALKEKRIFYPAIISFSLIIMITCFLIDVSATEGMFLIISGFVIGSVTLVIKKLMDLQKSWQHEVKG